MLKEDKELVDSEREPKTKRVLEMLARVRESIEKSNQLNSLLYWLTVATGGIAFVTFLLILTNLLQRGSYY